MQQLSGDCMKQSIMKGNAELNCRTVDADKKQRQADRSDLAAVHAVFTAIAGVAKATATTAQLLTLH